MKKLLFFIIFSITSTQAQKIIFNANIQNRSNDSIVISGENFKRIILGKNGLFSGSFTAPTGSYDLEHGKNRVRLYLKTGYRLNFTADASAFETTANFTGNGENENNFLLLKSKSDAAFSRN